MKKLFLLLILLGLSNPALATVDGHSRVFIVVKDVQTDEFFLERVPVIGCYGLPQGPQLQQFVAEYKVPTNIGCGGPTLDTNINALTCAKIIKSIESSDYMSFSEITLDISQCPYKNDAKFITLLRTAAKKNFPQAGNNKEVILNLIK